MGDAGQVVFLKKLFIQNKKMITCSKMHFIFSAKNQLVGGHSEFVDLVANWPNLLK